jgi:hypothetical protein
VMNANIPIANPAITSSSPMLKMMSSANLDSSLTILGHDIGLPRTGQSHFVLSTRWWHTLASVGAACLSFS